MAIQTGLEGKPWYYGAVVGALVAGALVAAAWYFLVDPKNKEIAAQEKKLSIDRWIEETVSSTKRLSGNRAWQNTRLIR